MDLFNLQFHERYGKDRSRNVKCPNVPFIENINVKGESKKTIRSLGEKEYN